MNPSLIIKSRVFRGVLIGIGAFAAALFVFQIGVHVGYRRASFTYRFGEEYRRSFSRRHDGRGPLGFPRGEFLNAHGTSGKIVSVNPPKLVVASPDGTESVVRATSSTSVRRFRDEITIGDLQVDEQVVLFGEPNEAGEIEAKLIRAFPAL